MKVKLQTIGQRIFLILSNEIIPIDLLTRIEFYYHEIMAANEQSLLGQFARVYTPQFNDGIVLNDPVEVAALKKAFAAGTL